MSCGCGYEKFAFDSGVMYYLRKYVSAQMQLGYDQKTFIATDYINCMAGSSDLDEFMYGADNTGHILKGWKWIDIVLCEDWKTDFENPDNFRQHSFSDRMYLVLSKRYGTNKKKGRYYYIPNEQGCETSCSH